MNFTDTGLAPPYDAIEVWGEDAVRTALKTHIQEIRPGLLLGDVSLVGELDRLREFGITHIVNLFGHPAECFPGVLTYLTIDIHDIDDDDIFAHFPDIIRFVEGARTDGGVILMHCAAGISRSAAAMVAYLIWKDRISVKKALDEVRGGRCLANPNPGFMRQLHRWEQLWA